MSLFGSLQTFSGEFLTGGEWVTWEDLSMEEFVVGEKNFHEGSAGFSSIV